MALPRNREDIALFFSREQEDQRLVRAKRPLHLRRLHRHRTRQRHIIAELGPQPLRILGDPPLGIGHSRADIGDGDRVLRRARLRQRFGQGAIVRPPKRREVLVLAHQRGQRIVAGGRTHAHLLDGCGGCRLVCPLAHLQRFVPQSRLLPEPRPRHRGDARHVVREVALALLDEAARART